MILKWIKDKSRLSKIPKIKNKEHFDNIIKHNKKVFIFTGNMDSPRFKVFSEGFYHY